MTTGDIYKTYQNISSTIGTTALTQRRIGDLITELDSIGIINASVRSFGRAGRSRIIELNIDKHIIDNFKQDSIYRNFESYKSPMQTKLM